MTDTKIIRILLLVGAMLCFFGTALFINEIDNPLQIIAIGLGLFAASFVP